MRATQFIESRIPARNRRLAECLAGRVRLTGQKRVAVRLCRGNLPAMGVAASEALGKARSGRVLTVFCDDVRLARHQFRAATEEQYTVPTLVTLEWARAPSLARELDEIQDSLANAAASLWPNWYITAERRFGRQRSADASINQLVSEAVRGSSDVLPSWLREAWARCRNGKAPLLTEMASAEQVKQLSRALDPKTLVFALSVESDDAPPARVRGLARAAEWLAREAQTKTLLLVPGSWRQHRELDHVNYGAVTLQTDEEQSAEERSSRASSTRSPGAERSQSTANGSGHEIAQDSHPQVAVGPVAGKPHPGSEVEKLVYERIGRDPELGGLFEYNQRLSAFGDKHYIVDLVWRRGPLVVELDGPEHHGHGAYVNDRERDYRLFMSGYTTLRISNHEVYVDVERVITKLRNAVNRLKTLKQGSRSDERHRHP